MDEQHCDVENDRKWRRMWRDNVIIFSYKKLNRLAFREADLYSVRFVCGKNTLLDHGRVFKNS